MFLFGTVGSPLSTPKKPGGTPGGILRLRELKLDALELAWVQSVRVSDETCAVIKSAAQEAALSLSVHAPYYINLNSQTKDMWAASRDRLLAAARAGYKAGYGSQGATLGFGVAYRDFAVDYAFVPVDNDLGDSHRFGVGFSF